VKALLQMLTGKQPKDTDEVLDGAVYSRYDQSVCIFSGGKLWPVKGVIFDLDDTLYAEKQYVKSGYQKVAELLGDETLVKKLWAYFEAGQPAIDRLLDELGMADRKADCLKVYREHLPEITLYEGVKELIEKLYKQGIKVGIITDGRVLGQKKKLEALGLYKLIEDIIITDELGGEQFRKPCDISFRIMQHRWKLPFEQIAYVGDNIDKDFQAPRQLGMQSVWFQNKEGLYYNGDRPDGEVVSAAGFEEIYGKLHIE
jgi:HAD superfamily hydrolase (TIGR01549 family)